MALEEAPPFWWKKPGPLAWLLSPFAGIWGWGAARRMVQPPRASVNVPVLCIGNFIAGGAGKTPTALAMAHAARKRGLTPGFLSRGHGGHLTVPTIVEPQHHHASATGDEPLLLAREALTVVSIDRPAGADLLASKGCDFIIMDDGFQNPNLHKDFSLVVVDAKRGIGNGWTIPSGPMRAPLRQQLALAGAVLVIGNAPGADRVIRETARRGKPFYLARTLVSDRKQWRGVLCIAYAGIADPSKFFDSLVSAGASLLSIRPFPDHHVYSEEEARDILDYAKATKAVPVTTAKDIVRMRGGKPAVAELAQRSRVLEISLAFEDPRTPDLVIDATLRNAETRYVRQKARR
jgi:tetraacyldisaccharide 4'-kinase